MSKMGQYVFEMQEDAYEMTEGEFVKKHGKQNRDIWEQINGPEYPEPDPEPCYPGTCAGGDF